MSELWKFHMHVVHKFFIIERCVSNDLNNEE